MTHLASSRRSKLFRRAVTKGRRDLLEGIRNRGFEVNVHDLNHDGSLFLEEREFQRRADRINKYVADFGTQGFRSGAMFQNQDWYSAFDFSYDMSVPNVAHLEPQRGGCCTVMPYFIGKILELPLTTIQDYSLFHILDDYSIDLWKHQIDLILKRNGLIIHHPSRLHDRKTCPDRVCRTPTILGTVARGKQSLDCLAWRRKSMVEKPKSNEISFSG